MRTRVLVKRRNCAEKSNWLIDEQPTFYDGLRGYDPFLWSGPKEYECLEADDNIEPMIIDADPEPE